MFSILKRRNIIEKDAEIKKAFNQKVQGYNHHVFNRPLIGPFPKNLNKLMLGMGCFWGVERMFWEIDGVYMTAVGYSGGSVANPSYEEVCSLNTGHNEVVLIHYNPDEVGLGVILKTFWEGHDPTQGMRQGNDIGTQYRSGIYVYGEDDLDFANETKRLYDEKLSSVGYEEITTEIIRAKEFYYAELYHQQYLAKNPNGYCGLGGTGVRY
tara:strand:- start:138 stop:767 length:630 start_codon:yes stop_codon:yes gene_type:complete